MATVQEVAGYILTKTGRTTAMKLQKLVYYSQAWHLVWTGEALFKEDVQAWANGPVVYELFKQHRGKYGVDKTDLDPNSAVGLSDNETSSIEAVLDAYRPLSGARLSVLTHAEDPWNLARAGLGHGDHSLEVITQKSMKDYYSDLASSGESVETVEAINFPVWAQ